MSRPSQLNEFKWNPVCAMHMVDVIRLLDSLKPQPSPFWKESYIMCKENRNKIWKEIQAMERKRLTRLAKLYKRKEEEDLTNVPRAQYLCNWDSWIMNFMHNKWKGVGKVRVKNVKMKHVGAQNYLARAFRLKTKNKNKVWVSDGVLEGRKDARIDKASNRGT